MPPTTAPRRSRRPRRADARGRAADAHADRHRDADRDRDPRRPARRRFAATPAGSVDWFGCDLPGNGDLKSWTNYVQRPFPPFPCPGRPGTITASGGATRVVGELAVRPPLPDRLRATSAPTARPRSPSSGDVTYTMPVHGIDESIGAFRIEIAAGGQTGTVFADGRAKPRDMGGDVCTTAPTQPTRASPSSTLDFTGITPVDGGGVKRWVHVPAKIAAGTRPARRRRLRGRAAQWGSFTIAVAGAP